MLLNITDLSGEPLHRQISQQLVARILGGELEQGIALKPESLFAREQRVSVQTVGRAYAELAREGLITYRNGQGTFVNPLSTEQRHALAMQQLLVDAQERRRMEDELMMAQQIQAGLLPKILPQNARLQMAASCEPARVIGGDFYDYLPIDARRSALVIADACGKGMPAAMVISPLQAIIKSEVSHGSLIRQTMLHLNQYVKRFASTKNFATLFYGNFDERTGSFEFANAGHHPPMLARHDGRVEFLKTTGPALGLLAEADHQITATKLHAGDCLLFYTDGVTETMNRSRDEFGEQRLQNLLVRHRRRRAQDLIRLIIEDLNAFRGAALLQDDRTMMILKILQET
jgi:sigma-B regulation protein RsbU (phosphoserine phosphatase)